MGQKQFHDFNEQRIRGEFFEKVVCKYLREHQRVSVSHMSELQQLGVDRVVAWPGGQRQTVEIKSDEKATKTHNVFIEHHHVGHDGSKTPGWVISSVAQALLYYLPGEGLMYCVNMLTLRSRFDSLAEKYSDRWRQAKNKTYITHGLCVPQCEMEALSYVTVSDIAVIAEKQLEVRDGVAVFLPRVAPEQLERRA